MKKILAVLLALMVLIGCTPYHDTKVLIDLDTDLSGVLKVSGSISKANTEESLESVQTVITEVVQGIEKYEGTLTSTIKDATLTFVYEENFSDLNSLNSIIKRLFNEDITVSETVEEQLFKHIRTIDGLKFSSDTFMNEIYDVIEKEELFGEDSDRLRSHQRNGDIIVVFDGEEYYSSETLEVVEYKKIEKDELTILIENDERISTTNVLTVEQSIDLEQLKMYYQEQFETVLDDEATLDITSDSNSVTVTMKNIKADLVADYQYELLGRFITFNQHPVIEGEKATGEIELFLADSGYIDSMTSHVEAYETFLDLSHYNIKEIDGIETVEESGFVINDHVITLNNGDNITVIAEENNPLKLVFTVLKYVGMAFLVIVAAIAAFFGFKKVKEANQKRAAAEEEENNQEPDYKNDEGSAQEPSELQDNIENSALSSEELSVLAFDKTKLPNIIKLMTHKASLMYGATMFGVFTVVSLVLMVFVKAFADSGFSDLTSMPLSITDQVSSFKLLRVMMNFISSGALKISLLMSDFGFGSLNETVTIAAYMIVFMIIIAVVTYFIYKKLFKENANNSLNDALSGTVTFVLVAGLLALIPVKLASFMGSNMSVSGSLGRVVVYTLPTALIVTYVMHTSKDKLNSSFMTVSDVVFDGLSRSVFVIVGVALATFLFALIKEKAMLVIFSNLIGFAAALFSGISIVGQLGDLSSVGMIKFDDFMPIMIVLYVLFIVAIAIDLNTKFKKSTIKDELKYSAVYTLAIYIPILFFGLLSTISMVGEGEHQVFRLDYLTLVIAPIITTGLLYVRLKYMGTFGFELPKLSKNVEKTTVREETVSEAEVKTEVEERVVGEEIVEKQQTEEES